MRILLINPPQILPHGSDGPYVFQPLGLAYVAAALTDEHEVRIFDAAAEGWQDKRTIDGKNYLGVGFDEIRRRIESYKPDMVGVTVPFTVNVESAFLVAMTAKSVDRGIVTVLGGPHPTIRPAETVSHPAVNFVVVGEGELTMPELVRTIQDRNLAGLAMVRGIAYKKEGKPVVTAPRPPRRAVTAWSGARPTASGQTC